MDEIGDQAVSVLHNRRRPGRAGHVSPELTSLLRGHGHFEEQGAAEALERGVFKRMRILHGFAITLSMSAALWAIILFVARWLLF